MSCSCPPRALTGYISTATCASSSRTANSAPSSAITSVIASPAAFRPVHDRFVEDVTAFARRHLVPIVQFERSQRKDDVAAQYRARFHADEGVVFIGVAQERQFSFKATKHISPPHAVRFSFSRQSVAVNQYYFYLHDADWGPAFIKVGTYLPHLWRCTQPARRVQTLPRQAVLQRAARFTDGDHHQ
jgi:hypothetical protein